MSPNINKKSLPSPVEVAQAWHVGIVNYPKSVTMEDFGRLRWTFLQGLPRLVRGEVDAKVCNIPEVLDNLGNRKDLETWEAIDEENNPLHFATELAARLLALGYLDRPDAPMEDRLLAPIWIDRGCESSSLTLARAVVAIELGSSRLLTTVLTWHASYKGNGLDLFEKLLRDEVAQLLLINGLSQRGLVEDKLASVLIRRLVLQTQHNGAVRPDPPHWLQGPLLAVWDLGRLFAAPDDRDRVAEFAQRDEWLGGVVGQGVLADPNSGGQSPGLAAGSYRAGGQRVGSRRSKTLAHKRTCVGVSSAGRNWPAIV